MSPHGLDAKSIETGRGALQPRAELARAKKQQNYSSAAPPKGRGILSVFLAGWNAISRGRIQSFAFRARDGSHLERDRHLVTRRFKIAANGGSIIGSFIRGPRARGAHTKSQHYRAMRSAGFAWDVAWAGRWSVHQLGLSWGCVGRPVRG